MNLNGVFFQSATMSLDNRGVITGGAGSTPGTSGAGAVGANGGAGGHGVNAVKPVTGTLTIVNSGQITGGNGMAGSAGTVNGADGAGGFGILLRGDGNITTSGGISGGLNGDGATRANAINLLSGVHTLTLQTGATFTGNVVVDTAAAINPGVSASNTLNFDSAGTGTVALPQFQNFGHLTQTGAAGGTWTLNGAGNFTVDAAVSAGTLIVAAGGTLTTPTTNVNGGILRVNGTVVSNLFVNAGGTLDGIGTVGATQVAAGGMFAPGSGAPGSSMNVGSLAMQSGALYLVQVDPATASFATVTGNATLGGATVNAVFANGAYVVKQYTIMTAGSINGTFDPAVANTNLPAGFQSSLSYDANNVYLNLALFTGPTFAGGLNVNQQNVANSLTNFFNTTGGIPMVFGSLTPAGLTQVSGELADRHRSRPRSMP